MASGQTFLQKRSRGLLFVRLDIEEFCNGVPVKSGQVIYQLASRILIFTSKIAYGTV